MPDDHHCIQGVSSTSKIARPSSKNARYLRHHTLVLLGSAFAVSFSVMMMVSAELCTQPTPLKRGKE